MNSAGWYTGLAQQFSGPRENLIEHLCSESSRLGILLTGMIGGDYSGLIVQPVTYSVGKLGTGFGYWPFKLLPSQ